MVCDFELCIKFIYECVDIAYSLRAAFDGSVNGVEVIAAVLELDDLVVGAANGHIVTYFNVFAYFNHSSLDVATLSGFHGGIGDTFTTGDGMKPKFFRI